MSTRSDGASAWVAVAAEGTDPRLLGDVVGAMLADEAGARRRVSRALDADHLPADAIREVAATRLLEDPRAVAEARRWHRQQVRVAVLGDPGYPLPLHDVADPPPFVAVRGTLDPLALRPVVAIVGARAATVYGRGIAAWLAEAASQAGAHVVSGGAVGIDAAAHGAAVEQPGGTTVVLGCGHDVAYPRPHAAPGGLFDRVVASDGALLGEFLPGTPPRAHRVRTRNRLVAGLADVVVVVEGGARSGSLLTATAAVERGVTVMAVPGDVRAPGSVAPHRLLREGADPCTEPADLLDALGGLRAPSTAADQTPKASTLSVLPAAVHSQLAAAWPRPVAVEDLARAADMATGALLAAVTRARVAGEVAQSAAGISLRREPSHG